MTEPNSEGTEANLAPHVTPVTAPVKLTNVVSAWVSTPAKSTSGFYGLLVVSGTIAVTHNLTGTSFEALLAVVLTLIVFFATHTYAATLAHLADVEHTKERLRDALRHGVDESIGLLTVGLIPVAVLALGVLGILQPSEAVWSALILDIGLLGVLGWAITAARVPSFWARLGGAVLVAAFGGIIVIFKILLHL